MVRRNLQVVTSLMPRQEAEEKYGFRLYQGGVVPTKLLRVVNIGGWDIEACGGTHSRATGEVGLIKITKAERIQDGVERLEFVAGEAAIEYMHRMDSELQELSAALQTQRENLPRVARAVLQELESSRSREKKLGESLADLSALEIPRLSKKVGSVRLYVAVRPQFGEDQIIAQGEKSVASDPALIYVSFFSTPKSSRVVCFVGATAQKAGLSAGEIVKKVAPLMGGSGGGSPAFAQGGGPSADRIDHAASAVESIVAGLES